jgi:predicted pyridoxine 5'-phosphate oxidase superfamily flavin-nucleotide-binding protein
VPPRPGSTGEHRLQQEWGTRQRADRFYTDQVLDHLNPAMREFAAAQEMFFVSTADARGECDCSFRAGPAGILHVLDAKTVCYPEYRGNGVLASLGNITENPHIGLHINGPARLVPDDEMRAQHTGLPQDEARGQQTVVWVEAEVHEAYIHCSKHIPRLVKAPTPQRRAWGTDSPARKGGDYFAVRTGHGRDKQQAQVAPQSGERPDA